MCSKVPRPGRDGQEFLRKPRWFARHRGEMLPEADFSHHGMGSDWEKNRHDQSTTYPNQAEAIRKLGDSYKPGAG